MGTPKVVWDGLDNREGQRMVGIRPLALPRPNASCITYAYGRFTEGESDPYRCRTKKLTLQVLESGEYCTWIRTCLLVAREASVPSVAYSTGCREC